MSEMNDKCKEDRALEALIVAALRNLPADFGTDSDLCGAEKSLTPEDRAALDNLGPDFIGKAMSGEWVSKAGGPEKADIVAEELELETALGRGGDEDLSDEVRHEMERRLRELDEQEGKEGPQPLGNA